jgi:putative transposase
MEEKFRNKYRTSSTRLPGWDYGSNGLYFVTICTKDRFRYFGEIENQTVESQSVITLNMTKIGEIAYNNWKNISEFHPYVELDDFVIMPDHLHGILFINKPDKTTWELNKFGTQIENLASIIRGCKSSVKTYATRNNLDFMWQPGYYDRVIRSEKEYINIQNYIDNNPDQWYLNEENFENLFNL